MYKCIGSIPPLDKSPRGKVGTRKQPRIFSFEFQENTFLLFPDIDLERTKLLILIHSNSKTYERRDANRRTWFKDLKDYPGIGVAFVVGKPAKQGEQKSVVWESQKFKDILQIDLVDDYWTLTIKETMAFKYAVNTQVRQ